MADKYLKVSKMKTLSFLDKMNQNKWKGILVVLAYSLLFFLPLFLGGVFQNKADLYHCSFVGNLPVILSPI
jgi:hypothetical protein